MESDIVTAVATNCDRGEPKHYTQRSNSINRSGHHNIKVTKISDKKITQISLYRLLFRWRCETGWWRDRGRRKGGDM